jgi:hypothetical protein
MSSVNDVFRAFASDLETFKLGFLKPLSISPMYVGCRLAFSASASWDNAFAFLCWTNLAEYLFDREIKKWTGHQKKSQRKSSFARGSK